MTQYMVSHLMTTERIGSAHARVSEWLNTANGIIKSARENNDEEQYMVTGKIIADYHTILELLWIAMHKTAPVCDLLEASRILVNQYQESGDFALGGKLTNDGFLKAQSAIKALDDMK